MKARRNESSKKPRCGGAAAAWLLVPLLVLIVLKTDSLPQLARLRETIVTQVSVETVSEHELRSKVSSSGLEREKIWQQQQQLVEAAKFKDAERLPKTTDSVAEAPPSPASSDEIASHGVDGIKDLKDEKNILAMNGEVDGSLRNSDVATPRSSKLSCNFSSERMDVCAMDGDIRVHGKSATVYVVAASNDSYRPENGTVTIRPYSRKWEISTTMQMVREVRVTTDDTAAPQCTVTHAVPAVVFSTGGYSYNFFHTMTDLVIPLFNTAREYDGHVQLLVTDFDRTTIFKLRHFLGKLSDFPVIDFDADDAVRCFPAVRVGIESHKELGIIPALSRKGYTMKDFQDFLQSAYSLKRAWATPANRSSGQRPRLLMMQRRKSRALTNEEDALAAARDVGFEVVVAGPEVVKNMAQFAEVVNSCDVMVGVHGAGLTNLVFLPRSATVVQIVPWGEMKWACWSAFRDPLPDMGLRYVEYEVTADETTLKDVYPRDHAVFTNPLAIHNEGFGKMWSIFLEGQNVTIDIGRFTGVMRQIYQFVTIS
ncbi:beta-1,2-xylosyltransferase XYXT1-like [Lolium rigidum]|uniref:beta-1,2-xylosyltransferase XYXT1-like n=1 Tax=Lolium rigidum TaxID=89674 RepID=UPI001F5C405D|nr:beta-1,2-xylosyltransferase XYXT1-like [Lolium rigidum]